VTRRGRPLAASSATPTDALVSRIHDFAESSAVVVLLTEDRGKVHALAKGAKRSSNSFLGPLDKCVLYRVRLGRRGGGEGLALLHSAIARESFPRLRAEPRRFVAASLVLELAADLLREGEPNRELFRLTVFTLKALDRSPPERVELLAAFFLVRAVSLSGHPPELSRCVACGEPAGGKGALRLSASRGGILHPACARGEPGTRGLSRAALALLLSLRDRPAGTALGIEAPPSAVAEARDRLVGWVEETLDRRFRSAAAFSAEFAGGPG
jgi:DNA repair protein RecO (recombination protein O)